MKNTITSNNNLELDCFEPDLRLAVEYDGEAHFKFIPFFHKNREAFDNQRYRDFLKDTLCKDNNITLIRVPDTVKYDDLEEYIKKELDKRGIFYIK